MVRESAYLILRGTLINCGIRSHQLVEGKAIIAMVDALGQTQLFNLAEVWGFALCASGVHFTDAIRTGRQLCRTVGITSQRKGQCPHPFS